MVCLVGEEWPVVGVWGGGWGGGGGGGPGGGGGGGGGVGVNIDSCITFDHLRQIARRLHSMITCSFASRRRLIDR